MDSKRKADSVLRFLFTLLSAGEAGISKSRLISDFECNERTLRRYSALLSAHPEQLCFEVIQSTGGETRFRLTLVGFEKRGGTGTSSALSERLCQVLAPGLGADLQEILAFAREMLSRPALEHALPVILENLESDRAVEFQYRGRARAGIPLCFFIHRDGQYLVVKLLEQAGIHRFSLSHVARVRSWRGLVAVEDARLIPRIRRDVMARLKTCQNSFVALERDEPILLALRFREFSREKVHRLFPNALAVEQPSRSDEFVHDLTLRFYGWLEASRFLHQYLGVYSILGPAWAAERFAAEVREELDEVEA